MRRRYPIETNSIHHIYSKSIYKFVIFTCPSEYERMRQLTHYYQYAGQRPKFSEYIKRSEARQNGFETLYSKEQHMWIKLVDILAFCFMPTHVHFILRETHEKGIQRFIEHSLNAYTRYFNLRHNRRGPLWEHRFGNTPIESDEHLHKAMDYVLTNPVKDNLVAHPAQ